MAQGLPKGLKRGAIEGRIAICACRGTEDMYFGPGLLREKPCILGAAVWVILLGLPWPSPWCRNHTIEHGERPVSSKAAIRLGGLFPSTPSLAENLRSTLPNHR
jgi:hypothetical protein